MKVCGYASMIVSEVSDEPKSAIRAVIFVYCNIESAIPILDACNMVGCIYPDISINYIVYKSIFRPDLLRLPFFR